MYQLERIGTEAPVVFPCHPRTKKNIAAFGLEGYFNAMPDEGPVGPGVYLMEPMGYDDFLYLWKDGAAMLTDSGGLQEETTALRVPCITMRENTERPITAEIGSNVIVGQDPEKSLRMPETPSTAAGKRVRYPIDGTGRQAGGSSGYHQEHKTSIQTGFDPTVARFVACMYVILGMTDSASKKGQAPYFCDRLAD